MLAGGWCTVIFPGLFYFSWWPPLYAATQMSSVPSQGFSCNRNNKLYRSMMSKSQTKDLNKDYEVSSHDYHCCQPGCADLCSADLAAALGTSDPNFSGAVNLINTIKREWRQQPVESGHLTCLPVGRVVLRWSEICRVRIRAVTSLGLERGDSLWEGSKGDPGMTGRAGERGMKE